MIQYFEKLQIDSNFEFVSKIFATFNVHDENDEVFCISLNTLTNVECMLTTKLLANHAAKHQIIDIDESENFFNIENSGIENFSISYAYISENDSFNDENSRIFDVFDFFEHFTFFETNDEISKHLISFETNGENSEHSTFFETKSENSTHFFSFETFSDDSTTQSIKRGRGRPRKHASKKNFIFTSDVYFFSNNFINRHSVSNIPYVKSKKKMVIESIDSNVATRSAE